MGMTGTIRALIALLAAIVTLYITEITFRRRDGRALRLFL